ncbi:protein BatD [Mucilaginibacter robiniae]|uniref:Protein BatD n=2 Tax=Mucilaginibacter robiniae TaxID=2728022 RepID=A0A7L5E5J9_9SPHI|nr:protein BatD [Mucilaginibacter robiniae]
MRIRYYIVLFLGLLSQVAFSQNVRFTASVSKTQVGTGEPFEITFSVNAEGASFVPPPLRGFEVVAGPNVSTSMTSINGNSSTSTAYSYDLVAPQTGEFVIEPASIVVGGKRYTTAPIKIKVVKGAPVQQNARSGSSQGSGADDLQQVSSGDIGKSLFIKAIVSKPSVYQGEQLTLTYRLYTRLGIEANQLDKMPDFNGFWNEDIKSKTPYVQWRTEVYKGQAYRVADIKQVILFPEHSGDISIEPMAMTFVVQQPVPTEDFMEQFFGNNVREVKYQAKSNKVTLHVKPLPEVGKPADFGGAVGHFTVNASLDKKELKSSEQLNYKVTVSGAGNLMLMQAPNAIFPADFEKFDPKVTDSLSENANGVSGYRTYSYLLIPRHQGNPTIEPVKFSYFNPETGRYQTIATPSFSVKVNKGPTENNVTAYADDEQDITRTEKDIRNIKTDDVDLSKVGQGFFGSIWYYVLLLLGPLLFGAAYAYRKWYEQYNSDIVKVKSRKASRIAAKHLVNAQKQLNAGNSKAFYEAVFRGLYGYLSNKLNIPVADLNRENIVAGLRARQVQEPLINQLVHTLDLCEMARYAPVSGIAENEVFNQSKTIIHDIEDSL